MTRAQTVETAKQIGSALVYLHARKPALLHLDLKPSNMILRRDGRICLTDFGAAMKTEDFAGRTGLDKGSSLRRGTPGYAAPELFDVSIIPDQRADLYELGAVLYRMISGKKYSEAMHHSHVPGCDDGLGRLIQRCLETDREKRFPDVKTFLRELEKLEKGKRREKLRLRMWAAILIAIPSGYLAFGGVYSTLTDPVRRQLEYTNVMNEILTAGDAQLPSLYREAFMEYPEGKDAWFSYLDWKGRDGILSMDEEKELRLLLHTIPAGSERTLEELFSAGRDGGEIYTRLGLLYWYGYDSQDAKRIAQGYFRKADSLQGTERWPRKKEPWQMIAGVFAHMGTYTDIWENGRNNTEEKSRLALAFWKDTEELLELEKLGEVMRPDQLMAFYRNCIARMMLDAGLLYRQGIESGELGARADLLEERIRQLPGLESRSAAAASDAAELLYGETEESSRREFVEHELENLRRILDSLPKDSH